MQNSPQLHNDQHEHNRIVQIQHNNNKTVERYSQPTLPDLLAAFGYQRGKVHEINQVQQVREEEKSSRKTKKQSRTSHHFMDLENEKFLKKENEKDEYYQKVVQDLFRLRNYYYKEYMRRLMEKVEKQRKEMHEKDIKQQKERERKETKQSKSPLQWQKTRKHHKLETKPFSGLIPKTDLYYIVGLEDKYRQEGKLKTATDYDAFRSQIQDPDVFYSHFKIDKNSGRSRNVKSQKNASAQSVAMDEASEFSQTEPYGRSVNRLTSHLSELSRSELSDENWAMTQQFTQSHKKRMSFSGLSLFRPRPPNLSDLEKRFPKLEMPKLHCFDMSLASPVPDPEKVQQAAELKTKEKHRRALMRQVEKMYQLAQTNSATSARIMDAHDDMGFLLQGADLSDVVIADHRRVQQDKTWDATGGLVTATFETDNRESSRGGGDTDEPDTSAEGNSASFTSDSITGAGDNSIKPINGSTGKRKGGLTQEEIVSFPLTMEEVQDKHHVVESKSLSTLWTNYLK